MIIKSTIAAIIASGLVVPEKPALFLPKPAIVKAENIEFTKHLLLGMPLTMGMLAKSTTQNAVSLVNRGTMVTTTSAVTTYTFSAYAIGTASTTRRVIAIVYASVGTTGRTLSSASIGGVSATINVQATHSSGGSQTLAIISATVPTGTTANIVATFSGAMARAACWAVAVDNLQSVTPVSTGSATAADPISGTVDQQIGGFVIAGAFTNSTSSYTWTGVTERVDTAFDIQTASGGDLFSTINSTGTSVSADAASPGARTAFVLANYR